MKVALTDRLTWLLLLVCGLLAAALADLVGQPGPVLEDREHTYRPVPLEGVVKIEEPPPLSAYGEVTARPLFIEGRRPPAQEPTAVAAVNLPFLLEGIVITADQKAILLRKNTRDKLQRLREGEGVAGWTLQEVTANEANFSSGEREQRLSLKTPPSTK